MPAKTLDRLVALRIYFVKVEALLPIIVTLAYDLLFVEEPNTAFLFKGDMLTHQLRFLDKIQSIVRLTRSSYLWPARPPWGKY